MAYVGTAGMIDAAGEALVTSRYACASTADPTTLTQWMMADVTRARVRHRSSPVGVVQDAAPELRTRVRTALTTRTSLRT